MFLSEYTIENIHALFNEAEGDEGTPTTDTPAEDTSDTTTDDTNTESTEDTMEEETNEDEYQMEEEDPTMEDTEGTGEEEGMEDTENTDGYDTDGRTTDEDPDTTIKKYYLLQQYNELYSTTSTLYTNIQQYYDKASDFKYDDITYILNNLIELKNKIIFTISVRYSTYTYQKLLTLYNYFESILSNLTTLTEKIIEDDME